MLRLSNSDLKYIQNVFFFYHLFVVSVIFFMLSLKRNILINLLPYNFRVPKNVTFSVIVLIFV
jgi:hypothetical protein